MLVLGFEAVQMLKFFPKHNPLRPWETRHAICFICAAYLIYCKSERRYDENDSVTIRF